MRSKYIPPRKRINPISDKQKERIRQLAQIEPPPDGRCQGCGNLPDWRGLSKHHEIKRSQGGGNDIVNIKFLCGRCHAEKHGIKEV